MFIIIGKNLQKNDIRYHQILIKHKTEEEEYCISKNYATNLNIIFKGNVLVLPDNDHWELWLKMYKFLWWRTCDVSCI